MPGKAFSPLIPPSFVYRSRLVAAGLLLFAFVIALSGCGGGDSESSNSPTAATATPLQPGDTRFLLSQGNAIESITLSGERTGLVTQDENQRIVEIALAPDRRRIAFIAELNASTNEQGVLDFGADLYVSDIDGKNVRLLLAHDTVGDYFLAPAWLNDSTLLVGWRGFDASGSTARIERVDVTTGEREVFMADVVMGTLSPDRGSIVYSTIDPTTLVHRLLIQDLSGNAVPRVLVDGEADDLAFFFSVAFSPDGSKLAFAALDVDTAASGPPGSGRGFGLAGALTHPSAQDIWLIDPIDGSGLHRVAELAEVLPSVSWSGNGSLIYVLGPRFLWRLDPATGAAEMLRESDERGAIVWLEGG